MSKYEIKVDGEYPFDKQKIQWTKTIQVSEKVAYELFCDVIKDKEKVDENNLPSITEFADKFLNKGYKFLSVSKSVVLALYKHDSYWMLIVANTNEFMANYTR